MVCGRVMADVERMVADMVSSLGDGVADFEFSAWLERWEASG